MIHFFIKKTMRPDKAAGFIRVRCTGVRSALKICVESAQPPAADAHRRNSAGRNGRRGGGARGRAVEHTERRSAANSHSKSGQAARILGNL